MLPEPRPRHIAPKGRWNIWSEERTHLATMNAILTAALEEANKKIAELEAQKSEIYSTLRTLVDEWKQCAEKGRALSYRNGSSELSAASKERLAAAQELDIKIQQLEAPKPKLAAQPEPKACTCPIERWSARYGDHADDCPSFVARREREK